MDIKDKEQNSRNKAVPLQQWVTDKIWNSGTCYNWAKTGTGLAKSWHQGRPPPTYWAVHIWNWNQVTLRKVGGTVGKVLCLAQSKSRLGIPWIIICGRLAKSVEMLERISYFTCFSPYLVAGERKGPLRAVRAGRLQLQLVHSDRWGENTWPSPPSLPQETPESGRNSYLLP